MRQAGYDALLHWLDERRGHRVSVSMQPRAGNVSLNADGALAQSEDDTLIAIDPPAGRRGELVSVDFDEPEDVGLGERLVALPARATARRSAG
jgi:hypothetical protein